MAAEILDSEPIDRVNNLSVLTCAALCIENINCSQVIWQDRMCALVEEGGLSATNIQPVSSCDSLPSQKACVINLQTVRGRWAASVDILYMIPY